MTDQEKARANKLSSDLVALFGPSKNEKSVQKKSAPPARKVSLEAMKAYLPTPNKELIMPRIEIPKVPTAQEILAELKTTDEWKALIEFSDKSKTQDVQKQIKALEEAVLRNYGGRGSGIVRSIVAGTNVTIDSSDPANPIVNSSGGGSPAGNDTDIQFNDSGSFGGDDNLIWNKIEKELSIDGNLSFGADIDSSVIRSIYVEDQTLADTNGNELAIYSGAGNGQGANGNAYLSTPARTAILPSDVVQQSQAGLMTSGFGAQGITLTVVNSGANDLAYSGDILVGSAVLNGTLDGGSISIAGGLVQVTNEADYVSGLDGGTIALVAGSIIGTDQAIGSGVSIGSGFFGSGTWNSGSVEIFAGNVTNNGDGGQINLLSGPGGTTSGNGGNISLTAQGAQGGDSNGGSLFLNSGVNAGAGTTGIVRVNVPLGGFFGIQANPSADVAANLDTSLLSDNRTYQFPDADGVLALETAASGSFTTADAKTITVVNGIITSIV